MIKNIGNLDKVIRIVLAVVLIALYFNDVFNKTWGIVALVAAGLLIITSLVSFCLIYKILGISTCPRKKEHLSSAGSNYTPKKSHPHKHRH